jgi:hypothetical protein
VVDDFVLINDCVLLAVGVMAVYYWCDCGLMVLLLVLVTVCCWVDDCVVSVGGDDWIVIVGIADLSLVLVTVCRCIMTVCC